jgi:hypothetical protein
MAKIFLVRFGKVGNCKRFNVNLLDVLNPASFQTRNAIRMLSDHLLQLSAFFGQRAHANPRHPCKGLQRRVI